MPAAAVGEAASEASSARVYGATPGVAGATSVAKSVRRVWLSGSVGINDGNNAFGRAGSRLIFAVVDGHT